MTALQTARACCDVSNAFVPVETARGRATEGIFAVSGEAVCSRYSSIARLMHAEPGESSHSLSAGGAEIAIGGDLIELQFLAWVSRPRSKR